MDNEEEQAALATSVAHLLNNEHQRVLFYNLSLAAERQLGVYRRFFYFLVLFVGVVACVVLYFFCKHRENVPIANPALEERRLEILDSFRDKYQTMRKDSWRKTVSLPATIMVRQSGGVDDASTPAPTPEPMHVAMRQLQHDGKVRKEHRKQKKVSFAK